MGDERLEPSDDELKTAWRAGDLRSGELLWRRHAKMVHRFFGNKAPAAVAMDLMQRTIEAALRSEAPAQSFRAYILGIAKHQLWDYLRDEQRKRRRSAELDTLVIENTVASPDAWVSAKREHRLLLRALRRLPLPVQVALELRYWEQMSDGEIADVLALPLGTIKSRLKGGRSALKREMAKLGASPDRLKSTQDSLEQWAQRLRP